MREKAGQMTMPDRPGGPSFLKAAIWIGFAIIVVHNVEEYLTIGRFLDNHRGKFPALFGVMTAERFTISLAIFTFLALFIYWAAAKSRPGSSWVTLALGVQVAMGVNAIQHAVTALLVRSYAPGLVLGLGACLPYAFFVARLAIRERWTTPRSLTIASIALILLTPFLLMAIHSIAAFLS